jgi:hypothetical protein
MLKNQRTLSIVDEYSDKLTIRFEPDAPDDNVFEVELGNVDTENALDFLLTPVEALSIYHFLGRFLGVE